MSTRQPYPTATTPSAMLDVEKRIEDHSIRDGWIALSLAGAAVMTIMDSLLIERRFGVFKGGFLAADQLRTARQELEFLTASMLADLAVVATLAAAVLWLSRRMRLGTAPGLFVATIAAVGPLAAADLLSYQLFVHLGAAFDLPLMLDLVGGHPRELFAVASEHLATPAAFALLASVGLIAGAWRLHRRFPAGGPAVPIQRRRRAIAVIVLVMTATTALAAVRLQNEAIEQGLRRKPSVRALALVLNLLTDFDRDGYGLGSRPADPDPFDAAVYPYAVDVPGDGIDQDGIGGDLPGDCAAYEEGPATPARWSWRPDIVVILLESVRADALGAVVDGKPATPVLDHLAAIGGAATLAYSHNGFTYQSRYHLLTGSLAGIRKGTSLIDDFHANGYEVGYFSGQDDTFGGPELAVGFERADVFYDARSEPRRRYTRFSTPGSLAVPAAVVQEQVSRFLRGADRDRPLFLYVNLHDTHFPYHHAGIPPIVTSVVLDQGRIAPERSTELRAMYLNTVAAVDRVIGEVLGEMQRLRGRAPAVIVTSDHGESLYESEFLGHGYALNDPQTQVPFVVANLPLALAEPFGHVDVRDALSRALLRPGKEARPRFENDPSRVAFQYLGSIDRPRQIGFVSQAGRTIYDFRRGQVLFPGSDWRAPDRLSTTESAVLLDLIHRWESMMLARARYRGEVS